MRGVIKFFLIDNDEEDQEIFGMALHEIDSTSLCYFAENGVDAIEKLNKDPLFIPSFIFIDMNMPLMNGIECLHELKKIDRLREVPLYIYSTAADPVSIAEVKQLGAADFITKPSSFKDLTKLLLQVLQLG